MAIETDAQLTTKGNPMLENDCTPQLGDIIEAPSKVNYASVRHNAIKHGVLSKLAVLPHEDILEFESLKDALIAEFRPSGPTQMK